MSRHNVLLTTSANVLARPGCPVCRVLSNLKIQGTLPPQLALLSELVLLNADGNRQAEQGVGQGVWGQWARLGWSTTPSQWPG